MLPNAPRPRPGPASRPLADQPPNPPRPNYCPLPQRLLADLRDNPLAIGLYALIARLYLVHQAPIPLSRDDILRYDPTLKPGAVKRACDRLVAGGWLLEPNQERQRKQRYTPTWGPVKGTAQPWRMGQPCLGRPRHISRLPLDRSLLDICMGKLTPHPTQPATISRYITIPVLTLADIGCYALTQAERPHETPNLRWLGLVRNGRALPLPAEEQLLALITQRPLTLDDDIIGRNTELTASGARRLGLNPPPLPSTANDHEHPLFFVPPNLIGALIGPLIGALIGPDAETADAPTAPLSAETRAELHPTGITWESNENRDQTIPPPPPPATGGGIHPIIQKEQARPRVGAERAPSCSSSPPLAGGRGGVLPNTPATQLLKTINVRPEQLIELAELPAATVAAAIADGRARDGIRDLAGWVVSLLRTQRDYGWQITPSSPRPDSPEALRAAFARYAADQEAATELQIADCRLQIAERAAVSSSHLIIQSPPPSPSATSTPSAMQTSPAPCHLVTLSPCLPTPPLRVPSRIPTSLWDEIQAALRLQITRSEFASSIRSAQLHSIAGGVATIIVPTAQIKERIETRLLPQLRDLLTMHLGEPISVRVILSGACRPAVT